MSYNADNTETCQSSVGLSVRPPRYAVPAVCRAKYRPTSSFNGRSSSYYQYRRHLLTSSQPCATNMFSHRRCKCFLSFSQQLHDRHTPPWLGPVVSYGPEGPAHGQVLRKSESRKHMVNYISSLNPKCNTLNPHSPKHGRHVACVIAQQYSSTTFVSSRITKRNLKLL